MRFASHFLQKVRRKVVCDSQVRHDMNEAETRAEHIDPALAAAGWGVVEGSRIRREYPITLGRIESAGKRGKALTADYVLEYRNTKLAVVEAKAWDKALAAVWLDDRLRLAWLRHADTVAPGLRAAAEEIRHTALSRM